MKTTRNILATLILVSIATALSAQTQTLERRYRGKPIIELILNNQKIWALLDTGSEYTVLDITQKSKFDFQTYTSSRTALKVEGFGSNKNLMHHVTKVDLRFGDTRMLKPILAFDFENIANSIEVRTGKRITAIIGTQMMEAYGFVIDLGRGTVAMSMAKEEKEKPIDFRSSLVSIIEY